MNYPSILLILLSFFASSCSAFFLPTSTSIRRLHSYPSGNNCSYHNVYAIRGGDSSIENTGNKEGISTESSQSLAAGIVGFPVVKAVIGSAIAFLNIILREIGTLTFHQKVFFVATFAFGFLMGRWRPFWKRFTDVNDIPNSLFGQGAPVLRGRAVSVSDGDTIRFLHQPTCFHPSTIRKEKQEKTSTTALPIRLCTVDTPETKKFGKSGQPFGEEAKNYLISLLENRIVRIRLLQKDQYGRAVAEVYTSKLPFSLFRTYVDAQLLKEGLAEVYTGGGAVYGPLGKDKYLKLQEKAQHLKKGIWSHTKRESAAEYKRRTNEK